MKADYTFSTAINMTKWLGEEWYNHKRACKQCAYGELDNPMNLCTDGNAMHLNRIRWHRRVRYAAKREKIKMTFSRLAY